MSTIKPTAVNSGAGPSHMAAMTSRSVWLPTLLSVIAGMVDLIGFLSLGIFTAHVTGNIVVVGALMVHHDRVYPAQILAIPVFILAVALTWLIARLSGRRNTGLLRPLLLIQFLLITSLMIFSAITKPSANPHGLMATIAAMIAVSAMGCQFALLRLTLPVAPSTAVMTGNLTNAVLGIVDLSSRRQPLMETDSIRLRVLSISSSASSWVAFWPRQPSRIWATGLGYFPPSWPPWPSPLAEANILLIFYGRSGTKRVSAPCLKTT